MANRIVEMYRQANPDDTRSDAKLTLDLAKERPDWLDVDAGFKTDYDRITKVDSEVSQSLVGFGDYVKQVVGEPIRKAADTIADLPRAAGTLATMLPLPEVQLGGDSLVKVGLSNQRDPEGNLVFDPAESGVGRIASGISKAGEKLSPKPVEELRDSFWASKLPGTFGSIGAFLIGGGLGKALTQGSIEAVAGAVAKDAIKEAMAAGASETVAKEAGVAALNQLRKTVAVKLAELSPDLAMGAATQAQSAYDEALAKTNDPAKANLAYLANIPIGAAMALPAHAILGEGSTLAGKVIKGGATAGVVMPVQTAASNLAAQQIYDPERNVTEGVGESAALGAITGGALGGLMHKLQGGKKEAAKETAPLPTAAESAKASDSVPVGEVYKSLDDTTKAELTNLAAQGVSGEKPGNWYHQQLAATTLFDGTDAERKDRRAFFEAETDRLAKEKQFAEEHRKFTESLNAGLRETTEPGGETPVDALLADAQAKRKAADEAQRVVGEAEQAKRDAETQAATVQASADLRAAQTDAAKAEAAAKAARDKARKIAATIDPDNLPAPIDKPGIKAEVPWSNQEYWNDAASRVADPKGKLSAMDNAAIAWLAKNHPEQHKEFLSKVGEMRAAAKVPVLPPTPAAPPVPPVASKPVRPAAAAPESKAPTIESPNPIWQQHIAPAEDQVSATEHAGKVVTEAKKHGENTATSFADTDQPAELFKGSKANDQLSAKRGVFMAPDGSHVLVGQAWTNGDKEYIRVIDSQGKPATGQIDPATGTVKISRGSRNGPIIEDTGYKLVASLRTAERTKGYVATHSIQDWNDAASAMRERAKGELREAGKYAEALDAARAEGFHSKRAGAIEGSADHMGLDEEGRAPELVELNPEMPTAAEAAGPVDIRFNVDQAGAIYDALEQAKGLTGDAWDQAFAQAIGESKRAFAAISTAVKVLTKVGVAPDQAVEEIRKAIYDNHHGGQAGSKAAFAESLVSRTRSLADENDGLRHPNAERGGGSGAEVRSGIGVEAGTIPGSTAEKVDAAAAVTDPNPTEAQKAAGNYQKGHVQFDGLNVTIENARGSTRSGKDGNGKEWSVTMPDHYGYVKGTEGRDGDQVDVYIGKNPDAPKVWVIDQIDPRTKKFDEHKAMLGYDSREEAVAAYVAGFSDGLGGQRLGGITDMPKEDFVDWVNEGDTNKPLAYGKRFRPAEDDPVDNGDNLIYKLKKLGRRDANKTELSRDERLSRGAREALNQGTLGAAAQVAGRSERAVLAVEKPKDRTERASLNRRIRIQQESELKQWAAQSGLLFDSTDFVNRWKEQGEKGGAEHQVYFDEQTGRWVKANNAWLHGNWSDYFRRLAIHNSLFPSTAYDFKGFVEIDGALHALTTQPDVTAERGATRSEVAAEMAKLGYKRTVDDNYYNRETGHVIEDLHDENALMTKNGSVVIMDPIPYIPDELDFTKGGALANEERPAWMTRERQRLAEPDPQPVIDERFNAGVDGLRVAGVNVEAFLGKEGAGASFDNTIKVALADVARPTAASFRALLHETGHQIAQHLPDDDVRRSIERAISALSDDVLALRKGFSESVSHLPKAEQAGAMQEGRLVEAIALKLDREGFDPRQSRGLAGAIVRMVKAAYARMVMAVQQALYGAVNPERAQDYFEHRVKALLSGDEAYSITAFLGGPKPFAADIDRARTAIAIDSRLRPDEHGTQTGLAFGNVVRELPVLKPTSVITNVVFRQLRETALRWWATVFGKTIIAADGSKISVANPRYPMTARGAYDFFTHITSRSQEARVNNEVALHPDKASWLPQLVSTLQNAQVRVVDPETGNRIYVARYTDPVTNRPVEHFVVVQPNGSIDNTGVLKDGAKLVTQFPRFKGDKRDNWMVDWSKSDARSQAHAEEMPGLKSLGSIPTNQNERGNGNTTLRYRQAEYVTDPHFEVSPDQDSTNLNEHKAAAQNVIHDTTRAMYDRWDAAGHNTTGLTFEQWREGYIRQEFGERPEDIIGTGNKTLAAAKQAPVKVDLKLADVTSESMQKRAAAIAHRTLTDIWTNLSDRRKADEWSLNPRNSGNLIDSLSRGQLEQAKLERDYTNAETIQKAFQNQMRDALKEMRDQVGDITKSAERGGVLKQVIRGLDEKLDNAGERQWRGALDNLYQKLAGDPEAGRKFTDILEAVANLSIDWKNDKPSAIQSFIETAAHGDPLLNALVEPSMDSKALLASVISFGKTSQYVMDLLQLRKTKAISERATVNAALDLAKQDHAAAFSQAYRMVKELPQLSRVATRLLDELREIKRENRRKLNEIDRAQKFIAFHQETAPVLQSEMNRMERIIGAATEDWEPTHGRDYLVPDATGGFKTKKLNLKADGMTSAELVSDMRSMAAWLDGVPENQRGAIYGTIKRQYDQLRFRDIDTKHAEIQGSWVNRLIAPLTDRLRFVGSPTSRSAAERINRMVFWMASKERQAHVLGDAWGRAEGDAMRATGIPRQDVFRRIFHDGAMSFIEKRQDILAGTKDVRAAEAAALAELQRFYRLDPQTAALVDKPKAWDALAKYFRQTAENSSWLDRNRQEMGLKIKDASPGYAIWRESIGAAPFTVMRGLSRATEDVWQSMRPLWDSNRLSKDKVALAYNSAPDALRKAMAARVTPEVWNQFVRPLVERSGRSVFYAPIGADGLAKFAARDNVIRAFEAAGGDIVKFAEHLYGLEGGKSDVGAFVGETLDTFQSFYNLLHEIHADAENMMQKNLPLPARYIMDARKSEEFPAEWLEYSPYDTHSMRQFTKLQSYQSAFGRDMEGMRSDLATAIREQRDFQAKHNELAMQHPDLDGKKLEQAIADDAKALGLSPLVLKQAERNAQLLEQATKQFDALLTMSRERPIEIQPWAEIVGTLTGLAVSGPGTAFMDTVHVFEQPFRKLGFNAEALKQIAGSVHSIGAQLWGSALQAVGMTSSAEAEYTKLLNELGRFDDDAIVSMKDRMRSLVLEQSAAKNPLLRGAVNLARGAKVLLHSGIGQAKDGAPIYPTMKPHSVFTMQAQVVNAAETIGWWKRYEALTAKAVQHFQANPHDLTDAKFRFTPEQLGYKAGRAWDYLNQSMANYGLSLEQVAREAVDRRSKDPEAALISMDQYRALAAQAQNEMTLESSLTTRMPGLMTNPVLNLANPLLGWAIHKGYDAWRGFREPNGERSWTGFKTGLMAYAAILPVTLAYAVMRDNYDEQIIGRKQNVLRLGVDNPFLSMLDNTARVGTFGIFGEVPNTLLNVDTQRDFSVDNRVFLVNTLLRTKDALSTWIRQGTADWQTVGRPLAQALGGSGYLQYADALNHALGLDNAEARVQQRINVSNYLRTTGRELGLDVRTGRGMTAMPNPIKPYVGQMVLAAYANDHTAFREAMRNAVQAAREEKNPDPEGYVTRSFASYNPLKLVFRTEPSEDEYQKILRALDPAGQAAVSSAVRLYNGYANQLGIKTDFGKKINPLAGMVPKAPSLMAIRAMAAGL